MWCVGKIYLKKKNICILTPLVILFLFYKQNNYLQKIKFNLMGFLEGGEGGGWGKASGEIFALII